MLWGKAVGKQQLTVIGTMWSPGTTVVGTFLLTFPVPETISKIKMNLVACIKLIMTKKKKPGTCN